MDLLFTILPFAIVLYCVYSIYKAVCIGTKKKGRHESLAPASQRIMLTNVGFGLKQSLSNHFHDP